MFKNHTNDLESAWKNSALLKNLLKHDLGICLNKTHFHRFTIQIYILSNTKKGTKNEAP